jgi:hypothetical protein
VSWQLILKEKQVRVFLTLNTVVLVDEAQELLVSQRDCVLSVAHA